MKSGVQALIINTPLWSPPLCQDQNPLWNLWFRWKHLQSSISYHWITWKFWSLWSYRTYRNPHVVIKSFWKCKWKQSKEIHLAWIAGDVAFMLSPCKTSKPPNLCIDAICQIQSQRCVRVWNKTQGKQSSMWSSSVNVFFDKYVFFYIWQIFDEVLNRVAQSHWLRLRSIKTDCHRVPRTKSVVRKFILKSALRCHRKQKTEFWYLLKKGSSINIKD